MTSFVQCGSYMIDLARIVYVESRGEAGGGYVMLAGVGKLALLPDELSALEVAISKREPMRYQPEVETR